MIRPRRAALLRAKMSKYFGALAAVNDLSFDVRRGEILGIGGPNGAGKTTLFEMISGLDPATAGKILFGAATSPGWCPSAICHAGIARTFQLNASFDTPERRAKRAGRRAISAATTGACRACAWASASARSHADAALALVGLARDRRLLDRAAAGAWTASC